MNHLVLFAKAPRLGQVKTRLLSVLSPLRVRSLYIAFLRDSVATARRVSGVHRFAIAFAPADGERLLRQELGRMARGWSFLPQRGGDLGERMRRAFVENFQQGAKRIVILGADSPTLPARLVENAFAALQTADVVLGPSTDGGFYLIGVRRLKAEGRMSFLERGIEWSTERVLEQTIAAARRAKLKLHLLDPWYDVDDAASLRFLRTHLCALAACRSGEFPKHTWRALSKMR